MEPTTSNSSPHPGVPAREGHHSGKDYPIGTLARLAGVSTRTIRYYEEIRLLKTARRYAGGRRVFPPDTLERLRFIGRLKRLGFSLEEISHLNEIFEMQQSTAAMLRVLDGQITGHLTTLAEQMLALDRMRSELLAYRERIRARLSGRAGGDGE